MMRALFCLALILNTVCAADTINFYRVTVSEGKSEDFQIAVGQQTTLAAGMEHFGSGAKIQSKASLEKQGNFYTYDDTRPLAYAEEFDPQTAAPQDWTQRDVGLRINGYMDNGSLELNYYECVLEQWVSVQPGLPHLQPVFSTRELRTSIYLPENSVVPGGALISNGLATMLVFERLSGDQTPPDSFPVRPPANLDQFRVLVYEKAVVTEKPTDLDAKFTIRAANDVRETGKLVELYELTTRDGRHYWFEDRRELIGGAPDGGNAPLKTYPVGTMILLFFDKNFRAAQESTHVRVNFDSRQTKMWLTETFAPINENGALKLDDKVSAATPFPIVGGTSFQSNIQIRPGEVIELSGMTESTQTDDGPITQTTRAYYLERIGPRIPARSAPGDPFGGG